MCGCGTGPYGYHHIAAGVAAHPATRRDRVPRGPKAAAGRLKV